MIQVDNLDNIDDVILDKLVELYQNNNTMYISDERCKYLGTKKYHSKYFLIRKETNRNIDFTFIWIDNNLWQFRYCNVECSHTPSWRNPIELLNELLNPKKDNNDNNNESNNSSISI